MLLDKDFELFLKEDPDSNVNTIAGAPKVGPSDSPSGNSADDVDVALANIHHPHVLDRLNGFLSAITAKPYLNPYTALNQLRNKLAIGPGLSWGEDPYFVGDSGVIEKKLVQFGGRFGWDPILGDVTSDDGLSRIPGGLKLKLTWMKVKGMYHLDAQIVASASTPEKLGEGTVVTEEQIAEFTINEVSPPGMEDWTSNPDVKSNFKKQYGDRWKEVMYAKAWKKHNESVELGEQTRPSAGATYNALTKTVQKTEPHKGSIPLYKGPKGKMFTVPKN